MTSAQPKTETKAPPPASVPKTIEIASIASRESDPPRGGVSEIVPSTRIAAPRVPDQIEMATGLYRPKKAIIKPGRYSDQLKSLGPTRPFTLTQLKANPRFTLGKTKVDMSRVLANPQSVANRAIALGQLTDVVRVNSTAFDVTEVKSGLVVRSFINYSLRPGACTIPARRQKVEASGVRCATMMTAAARDKAFSTPGDPRYIADPAQRAEALAKARERADDDAKMLAKSIATVRADLKVPQLRAEMVAALGESEVKWLEGLDDTGLAAEIVNSGDTKMEDVSYIPINDVAESFTPAVKLGLAPPPLPPKLTQSFGLGTHYFLAGFTFGREYEWRLRVEQRVNLCLIGCAKTYYVEAFAGFNYGLGLRFPIELTGSALYQKNGQNGQVSASVTPKFRTLDGNAEQYLAAGLPPEKLFDAQEFVAQFGAHAGFGFDVPFNPPLSVNFARELDFADYLEGSFKGGHFKPPVPGQQLKQFIPIDDVDLIGGQANFGFVGAQVFPAANVILTSDGFSLTLVDKNGGVPVTLKPDGGAITLGTNPSSEALQFDIKDPVYNLTMTIEPGINARVFVDIGFWGKTWDMPVFFPSLAVTVPSGGVTFGCHDGTVCTRAFDLAPDAAAAAQQELATWVHQFEKRWLAACPDSICEKEIRSTRIATAAVATAKINKGDAPANLSSDPNIAKLFNGVEGDASKSWGRAILRRFSIEFEPTWAGKCPDNACRNTIKALRTETEATLKQLIAAGIPAPDPGKVFLGISYSVPVSVRAAQTKARAAVTASISARIAASGAKWIGKVKAEYDPKCWDDQCRHEVALGADAMGAEAAKLAQLSPDVKSEHIVTEVIARFRPRLAKAVADGLAREKASIIK